jgi:hypothetical protein
MIRVVIASKQTQIEDKANNVTNADNVTKPALIRYDLRFCEIVHRVIGWTTSSNIQDRSLARFSQNRIPEQVKYGNFNEMSLKTSKRDTSTVNGSNQITTFVCTDRPCRAHVHGC